jgi:16S rRNA processing protein RimM
MGRIVAPFGVKGWVKLKVFTERPDSLLNYPTWWLASANGWQKFEVAEAEFHAKGLVVRLAGVSDRTGAESLSGVEVGVPREAFPEPEADEFYWSDLIGLDVVNRQDEALGKIEGFLETGANDVLVVRSDRERLIPYVAPTIVAVDLQSRRVVVDWGVDY